MDLKYKYVLILLPLSLILILCLFLAVSTSTPMSPSLSTEVMDYDYNNDGVIDNADKSLLQEHLGESTSIGSSNRKFDNNYDGVIDESDVKLLDQSKGLELSAIADGMFTGETTYIDYSFNPPIGKSRNWDFTLFALDKSYVKSYWGSWLDIHNHPYGMGYRCIDYGADMMKCGYKDLGYGTIGYANSNVHGYNIFYTGGDWHNLKNWIVLEPQTGWMVRADKPTKEVTSCGRWGTMDCSYYRTAWIAYPVYTKEQPNHVVECVKFTVNFENGTVHKARRSNTESSILVSDDEEPSPDNYKTSYHPHQSIMAAVANQMLNSFR